MFESAEIGHRIDKAVYRVEEPALREALLDVQFSANMWKRAVLTSPQLTTYQLGYRDIHAIWLDWRQAHGDRSVSEYVDAMLALGAVPVREYRAVLLPDPD